MLFFKKTTVYPPKVTLLLELQPERLTSPQKAKFPPSSIHIHSSIHPPTYSSNATSIHLFNSHKKSPRKGNARTIEKCVASRKLNVKKPCFATDGGVRVSLKGTERQRKRDMRKDNKTEEESVKKRRRQRGKK